MGIVAVANVSVGECAARHRRRRNPPANRSGRRTAETQFRCRLTEKLVMPEPDRATLESAAGTGGHRWGKSLR